MNIKFLVQAGLSAAIILCAGVVHGRWTDRWTLAPELASLSERLPKLPLTVGHWRGVERELNDDQRRQVVKAEIVSLISRRYDETQTKDAVSVILVNGRPGPISVHTPESCYGGVGFELTSAPVRVEIRSNPNTPPAVFWRGEFRKVGAVVPETIRIYWTWAGKGGWEAVDNPRLAFSSSSALLKLYVVQDAIHSGQVGDDAGTRFIKAFLPELERMREESRVAIARSK